MNNNKNLSGVYFSFLVSEEDAKKLNDFGEKQLGLDMKNSGSEYESRKHSTLFASKDVNLDINYQQIVEEKKDQIVKVTPVGWKLIKSHNTGKTCLALVIHSEELVKSHQDIKEKTGLNHAFSDFITHISIHYDFEMTPERLKNMPLPDFDITLDRLFTKDYTNKYDIRKDEEPQNSENNNPKVESKKDVLSNIKNMRSKMFPTEEPGKKNKL